MVGKLRKYYLLYMNYAYYVDVDSYDVDSYDVDFDSYDVDSYDVDFDSYDETSFILYKI
jgi:hypothetical protein